MATYRLSVYTAQRSEGRSATAMAAYRACEAVLDERTGEQHDYTRKSGLLYSEIITPEGAPEWARDRAELWNRSEAAHKRGDAIIAREMQLSLPHELDAVQRRELATEFAHYMADRYGVAVDTALHAPNRDGDERNYHAHLMLCTRPFDDSKPHGLGNNERAFDAISHQKAGTENHVSQWRETWEKMINNALERANVRDSDGAQVTVDHRSYKAREIDLEPQLKEGAAATARKRNGQPSDRAEINAEIKARNAEKMDAEELRRRQAEQIFAQDARDLLSTPAAPSVATPEEIGDPTRRQAANMTASDTRAAMPTPEPDNDNTEPVQRQAQNITAEQATQELTASHDNAVEQHTPEPKYTRRRGENETQFEARVARLKAQDERDAEKEEHLKPEMHYRPSGPVFGR